MLYKRELLHYTGNMKRIVRTVLLWVMVIALPVQGIAASLMTFCGPSHALMMQGVGPEHHGTQAPDAKHGPAAHLPMSSDSGVGHGDASVIDGPADDAAGLFSFLGQFSCSACAACCSMVGLPASLSLPGQPHSVQSVLAWLAVSVQSHLPDGLDRPPRAVLA